MRLGIELINEKDLIDSIKFAAAEEISHSIKKGLPRFKRAIKDGLFSLLIDSLDVQSLINGQLRTELGVPEESSIVNILREVADNISIEYEPPSTNASLGFANLGVVTIGVLPEDYSNLFSMPDASYTTDKGEIINWLEWLLTFGDKIIIADYTTKSNPRFSRTGDLIMVAKTGFSWRVPPQYSGVHGDNILTRALENLGYIIEQEVEGLM